MANRTVLNIDQASKFTLVVEAAKNRINFSRMVERALAVYSYLSENHPDDLANVMADIEAAQSTESEVEAA